MRERLSNPEHWSTSSGHYPQSLHKKIAIIKFSENKYISIYQDFITSNQYIFLFAIKKKYWHAASRLAYKQPNGKLIVPNWMPGSIELETIKKEFCDA